MNWRKKRFVGCLGELDLARPYYHCKHCHTSQRPWDAALRLGSRKLTRAAEELVALAGLCGSFEEAAEKTLVKMSGIRLSESTVERVTEDAGERVRQMLDERICFGEARWWAWHRDAQGRRCAYVSGDATGVRQQGPGGTKADGRMAYVGMIYNPPPRDEQGKIENRRYLAGFYDLTTLGRQLHGEALHVGWQTADVQIALSDGAHCLEKFFATYFPRAVLILDFWHAAEHLAELARAVHPGEQASQEMLDRWCSIMKHQGGQAVLSKIEGLDLTGRNADVREVWRKETNYIRNNVHRMDYPHYLANGWHIGSGPMEAACKTVVAQRLKGSGMRWSEPGADAVVSLRALYLSESDQWDHFWNRPHSADNASYLQN